MPNNRAALDNYTVVIAVSSWVKDKETLVYRPPKRTQPRLLSKYTLVVLRAAVFSGVRRLVFLVNDQETETIKNISKQLIGLRRANPDIIVEFLTHQVPYGEIGGIRRWGIEALNFWDAAAGEVTQNHIMLDRDLQSFRWARRQNDRKYRVARKRRAVAKVLRVLKHSAENSPSGVGGLTTWRRDCNVTGAFLLCKRG